MCAKHGALLETQMAAESGVFCLTYFGEIADAKEPTDPAEPFSIGRFHRVQARSTGWHCPGGLALWPLFFCVSLCATKLLHL